MIEGNTKLNGTQGTGDTQWLMAKDSPRYFDRAGYTPLELDMILYTKISIKVEIEFQRG